jgi:Tfp pilus assembly protein PilX
MAIERVTRSSLSSDERGMSLALALIAIIVIGALVTGTFFAGRMEMVAGRNTVYTMQASEAAEAGLAAAFSPWNRDWNDKAVYMVGSPVIQPAIAITLPNGTPAPTKVQYRTTVNRLQGGTYLISSVGQKLDLNNNVLATRMLAKIAKLIAPGTIHIDAAVTTKDEVTIGGDTNIEGHDTNPAGWNAGSCGTLQDAAGVRTSETVNINGNPVVNGDPPMLQGDSTVTNSTFQEPFYTFLGAKTTTVTDNNPPETGPTLTGALCNKTNLYNWGEPRRGAGSVAQCQSYFPVVYYGDAGGELKLEGGVGQGVLLVAGDLTMSGGFEFVGLIIVLGEVKVTGTGAKVTGGILSNNFYGDASVFGGTSTLTYSSCAIGAALTGASDAYPLGQRAWVQLNPR